MKEKLKERKGVTLIALVVTIIVLLILAGVTIALVLGNNGIIKRAQDAKEQTAQTQNKEMEGLNNLENYMNDKIEGIVSADDIAKAPETYYGKEITGYTCTNSAACKWKIFYAGSDFSTDEKNHIYLIADDYIENRYCPTASNGSSLNVNGKYKAYFTDILGSYNGSSNIMNANIKKLNDSYFSQDFSSTSGNMKAVAYMCDENAWSVYKGAKADYAVGGPSIEMLMKSYSQKYNVDYKAKALNAKGYQISTNGGALWKNIMDNSSEYLNKSDSLYAINSGEKASAYWLASSSANDINGIVFVFYNGCVASNYLGDPNVGFRPLVCLNSDVKLQYLGNGTFAIK